LGKTAKTERKFKENSKSFARKKGSDPKKIPIPAWVIYDDTNLVTTV
jgi:hypothetical protein